MLMIDAHPAGWSVSVSKDRLSTALSNSITKLNYSGEIQICFCHTQLTDNLDFC